MDFSFIKIYWLEKYWKPQGLITVVGFQHPQKLRHLLVQMRMVLRLRDIGQINIHIT